MSQRDALAFVRRTLESPELEGFFFAYHLPMVVGYHTSGGF